MPTVSPALASLGVQTSLLLGLSRSQQLPGLHCNVCNELWESVPVTSDNFGNAPKQPSVVFSSDLLQFFRLLSKKGLSAADFCAAQTDLQAQRAD